MPPVKIYTTSYCPWCTRAKALLAGKGVKFDEVDVTADAEKRTWLVEATGRRTVPQIFIGDEPVGGHDDLVALIKSGDLDRKLGTGSSHSTS